MIEALGIACVKNEADVIEAFVRHNLAFMDALFILENDSVDGTREILVELRRQGLPIVLFDDPIVGHFQAEKVTAVYRQVVPKFKPRFVFLLDADEFIVTPSREALYGQLRSMHPGSQAQYYWRTYVPAPTAREGDAFDPLRSITHHRISEDQWAKSIIVTSPKIDTRLKIQQGNHNVKSAGRSLPTVTLQNAVLAHFPVRSIDQATSKALVGWITNLERYRHRRRSGFGFQKKLLYERIVHGGGLTPEDVTHEALKYAQSAEIEAKWPNDVVYEPVVPRYERLTEKSMDSCTPLQKVVRCVDKILNPDAIPNSATTVEFLETKPKTSRARTRSPYRKVRSKLATHNLYVDLPPFRHIAESDCPDSVLQIGCGAGAYLKYFASQGTRTILGVDSGDGKFGYLEPQEYLRSDPTARLQLGKTFDLVICTGVIEHVSAQSEGVVVDNIVRHANKRIVFSGARPGQPGADDLNRQPIAHWLDLFASSGWYVSQFDTLALRSLSTFPGFRENLVVLTRGSEDGADAAVYLTELENDGVKWRNQRPAVIGHPFTGIADELSSHSRRRWLPKITR